MGALPVMKDRISGLYSIYSGKGRQERKGHGFYSYFIFIEEIPNKAKRMNDNAVETAIDFYIVSTESSCADCLTYLLISARVEQVNWI